MLVRKARNQHSPNIHTSELMLNALYRIDSGASHLIGSLPRDAARNSNIQISRHFRNSKTWATVLTRVHRVVVERPRQAKVAELRALRCADECVARGEVSETAVLSNF